LLTVSDLGLDLCASVVAFLSQRLPLLCDFASTTGGYTAAMSGAVRIVIRMVKHSKGEPLECIVNLTKFLFDLSFELPGNTVLHQDCLLLFASLPVKKEAVQRSEMIERISSAFVDYRKNVAVYWGCLHTLAKLILKAKVAFEETEAWKNYIAGPFQVIETIVKAEYGGPSKCSYLEYSSDGSYADYEEEEEDQVE
jgi:hypothetical protein